MPNYRIYFVGEDDHFYGVETIDCPSDDDAVALARERIGLFAAVEVWCGARSLGRISAGEPWHA